MLDAEALAGRHPSTQSIARLFVYREVDQDRRAFLDQIREECAELAEWAVENLPDGPELTAGLRKLLEAKDCFVRSAL